LLAGVIEGDHAGFALKGVDAVGVGGGCAGGKAVVADLVFLGQAGGNGGIPQGGAILQADGDQVAFQVLLGATRLAGHEKAGVAGDVGAVAPDDGAGGTRAG